jgi:hypothetical protein
MYAAGRKERYVRPATRAKLSTLSEVHRGSVAVMSYLGT